MFSAARVHRDRLVYDQCSFDHHLVHEEMAVVGVRQGDTEKRSEDLVICACRFVELEVVINEDCFFSLF